MATALCLDNQSKYLSVALLRLNHYLEPYRFFPVNDFSGIRESVLQQAITHFKIEGRKVTAVTVASQLVKVWEEEDTKPPELNVIETISEKQMYEWLSQQIQVVVNQSAKIEESGTCPHKDYAAAAKIRLNQYITLHGLDPIHNFQHFVAVSRHFGFSFEGFTKAVEVAAAHSADYNNPLLKMEGAIACKWWEEDHKKQDGELNHPKACELPGLAEQLVTQLSLKSDLGPSSMLHTIKKVCKVCRLGNGDKTEDGTVVKLRKCGNCGERYCSPHHQQIDWHAGHREECRAVNLHVQQIRTT